MRDSCLVPARRVFCLIELSNIYYNHGTPYLGVTGTSTCGEGFCRAVLAAVCPFSFWRGHVQHRRGGSPKTR